MSKITTALALALTIVGGCIGAAAEELCVNGTIGEDTETVVSSTTSPALTATDCGFDAGTSLALNPAATSLSITGGFQSGSLSFTLAPNSAFTLTISGFQIRNAGLLIQGSVPEGSLINITGCHFSGTPDGSFSLAMNGLEVTKSTLNVANNIFSPSTSMAINMVSTPKCSFSDLAFEDNVFNFTGTSYGAGIELVSLFSSSSLTIRRNQFIAENISTSQAYPIHLEPWSNLAMDKSFKMMGSRARKTRGGDDDRRVQNRRNRPVATAPAARSFDVADIDWANVTDEEARLTYGKGTYDIRENTFANMFYPVYIYEGDGKDIVFSDNVATHASSSLLLTFESSANYYRVDVSFSNNVINASSSAGCEFYTDKIPQASTFSITGNTFISAMVALLHYPIFLSLSPTLPATSMLLINDNELIANNGTTGYIPAATYLVNYVSRNPTNLGKVTLCNNVLYGVVANTDALINRAVFWSSQPRAVAPASECENYTAVNSSPLRGHRFAVSFSFAIAFVGLFLAGKGH